MEDETPAITHTGGTTGVRTGDGQEAGVRGRAGGRGCGTCTKQGSEAEQGAGQGYSRNQETRVEEGFMGRGKGIGC